MTFLKFIFSEKIELAMYNLTDTQKNVAKWLVQSVRVGHLDEAFRIIDSGTMTIQGDLQFLLSDYRGIKKELYDIGITKGSLQALVENNLLLCRVTQEEIPMSPFHDIQSYRKETWDCTLTGSIYTAVDNDFNSPDTSFIDYLIPLANPSGFDEALTKRCFPILATGGSDPILWDSAVRTAGVILEERLRDVGSITKPNRTGRDLVNDVFGDKGTLTSKFPIASERLGYRELYSGIVGTFRNPSAHRFIDPSPEEGGAFIVFVNLLLKKLEDLR